MFSLIQKELVQIRQELLQIVGILALGMIVFGKSSPSFVLTLVQVMAVTFAMVGPQLIFGQEERGNTFVFLRALPIRPSEIVAAKYLVSILLTVIFLVLIGLTPVLGLQSAEQALVSISAIGLASFVLSGISLFLHFWLGGKAAAVGIILVSFGLGAPIMLMESRKGSLPRYMAALARGISLASTPGGVCLALLGGLAILGAFYAATAWLFTKRDLSRLP